jgi:WD40 repeat protein
MADFYSTLTDCNNCANSSHYGLPYCVAPCNTNSLVAVGDEEGLVKLFDTDISAGKDAMETPYIDYRLHSNAILDITFSEDDRLLATACGDQTSVVYDVPSMRFVALLEGHAASLRQVRFQPGSDKVLATSSRDGTIRLWDLRCTGASEKGNVGAKNQVVCESDNSLKYAKPVDVIRPSGHPVRASDISITALSFLPGSGSNYLLAGSASSPELWLWDLRKKYKRGQHGAVNSAWTAGTRGTVSIDFGGDGNRFYTLSRAGLVSVFSTTQLLCGSKTTTPLHKLSHPAMRVNSFYGKLVVRKNPGMPELLAAGGSRGDVIIWPTNEAYLGSLQSAASSATINNLTASFATSGSQRSIPSQKPASARTHVLGTALCHGHGQEVSGTGWTHSGELFTVGDDSVSRVWRQDANKAAELRTLASRQEWMEKRHAGRMVGVAEVDDNWDED